MADDQITKLSKEVRKGFNDVDKKITVIKNDLGDVRNLSVQIDEQLDQLTKMVIRGFGRIDKVLETKANTTDIQKIFDNLDSISSRLEITEDERLVMASQLTRLHDWVEKAAKRIDLKFEY